MLRIGASKSIHQLPRLQMMPGNPGVRSTPAMLACRHTRAARPRAIGGEPPRLAICHRFLPIAGYHPSHTRFRPPPAFLSNFRLGNFGTHPDLIESAFLRRVFHFALYLPGLPHFASFHAMLLVMIRAVVPTLGLAYYIITRSQRPVAAYLAYAYPASNYFELGFRGPRFQSASPTCCNLLPFSINCH